MNSKRISVFIFHIIFWQIAWNFNVDTDFAIVYSHAAESYFGYSVTFHLDPQEKWLLLVGAPRANQSTSTEINQPGTIFQCKETCNEVILDPTGNRDHDGHYHDLKNNGWLGVTLDSNTDGTVLACAHRWKNQKLYLYSKSDPNIQPYNLQPYYSNGMCYVRYKNFSSDSIMKLIPLVLNSKQVDQKSGVWNYAFGMAGISTHFTEDKAFIIGAPGVYDWEGHLVTYTNFQYESPVVWGPHNNQNELSNIYLGYAVTSGRFRNPTISHVGGAPRHNHIGKVYVARLVSRQYEIESFTREGKQLGEYFGAAVAATDLNGDDYEDLIVGAPLHSVVREEGKVYVYINRDGNDFNAPEELWGSKIEGARFGMTVTAIGDIDRDGFKDIAVGAPYENDCGAVYIYHGGNEKGLQHALTQRLQAREIDRNLRGFGISIAKSRDIDRNNYPDLAIGSYESGHAVILRSRQPLILNAKLTISPSKLSITSKPCNYNNQNVGCFNVTTCIKYESPTTLGLVHVLVSLSVDALSLLTGQSQRAFFNSNGERTTLSGRQLLQGAKENCNLYQVFLKPNIRNYLTPIDVTYEFRLPDAPTTDFCLNCPILSPKSKTFVSQKVYFLKGCKDDNYCQSDLHMKVFVMDNKKLKIEKPQIWIGLNKSISFNVTTSNSGEAAFLTQLNVTIPLWSNFKQLPTSCSDDNTQNDHRFLICDIGNPLTANGYSALELNLDVQNAPKPFEMIVEFEVTTGSNESPEKLNDNKAQIKIPIDLRADITVLGYTKEEYVLYTNLSDPMFPFKHTYEVLNLGPSLLDLVEIYIDIPASSNDDNTRFIKNIAVKTTDGNHIAKVTECKGADASLYLNNDGSERDVFNPPKEVKRKKRDAFNSPRNSGGFQLFCDNTICRQIVCEVQFLAANEKVKIELELLLDTEELTNLKLRGDIIDYATEGRAVMMIPPGSIQPPDHHPDLKKVITSLDSGHQSPASEMPPWVIPVSIILGFLLLVALTAIFYKLGFFNRAQRDALKQAQENASDAAGPPEPTAFSSQENLVDE